MLLFVWIIKGKLKLNSEDFGMLRFASMANFSTASIVFIVMVLLFRSYASVAVNSCAAKDRKTLLEFKAGFMKTGELFNSWSNANCCSWAGITCNSDGFVNGLAIRNLDDSYAMLVPKDGEPELVNKYIPRLKSLQFLNLFGMGDMRPFPTALASLPALKSLSLVNCMISADLSLGSAGGFQSLEVLDLSSNSLKGSLPSTLCHFTHLKSLNIAENSLNGWIPACLPHNMPYLTYLNLSRNSFTGIAPPEFELSNHLHLQQLDLHRNSLRGYFPSALFCLPQLHYLDLRYNSIEGTLPTCLGSSNLQYLRLSANRFKGSIPSSFGPISQLIYLELNGNFFSGQIPSSLGSHSNLRRLYLHQNIHLSGTIPDSLGNLRSLQDLRIGGGIRSFHGEDGLLVVGQDEEPSSRLTGAIPTTLGNLHNLEYLLINACKTLSGLIPANLGKLSNLRSLLIRNTGISGYIPTSLADVSGLELLDLQNNKLIGQIPPALGLLSQLQYLLLFGNSLRGVIPPELGSLSSLSILNLGSNQLSGAIPTTLENLPNMTNLDLSHNHLSGSIPSELGESHNGTLVQLDLSYNNLSGIFPVSLCYINSIDLSHNQLPSLNLHAVPRMTTMLSELVVASNALSGPVPDWLSNQTGLTGINLSNNSLSGKIPSWINTSTLGGFSLFSLILSQNRLSGPLPYIPNANVIDLHANLLDGPLSSFNSCYFTAIMQLDLSDNRFSGPIPDTVGPEFLGFNSINFFSLARNKFSGAIPQFLGDKMTELNLLNLSGNGFTGPIPSNLANIQPDAIFHTLGLQTLDLSHNQLGYRIPPELGKVASLTVVDVSYNNLAGPIPSEWSNYNSSGFVGNRGLCGAPLAPCKS